MKRVGVVVHPTRDVLDALEVLRRWTLERGLELVQVEAGEQPPVAPPGDVGACDLVVSLGGDGTILKALHASARTQTPVLGVACGSLGALATLPAIELPVGLSRFWGGDWSARHLSALAIGAAGSRIASAINDLVLGRGKTTQLVLDVCIDGDLYVRVAGDGIVVATPLGSSAYSMAAGGSLLAAGTEGFICTPLAMHGGCAPPLVVRDGAEVTLEVHPGHGDFYLTSDGFPVETAAQRFAITGEPAYATLVALDDSCTGLARLRARGLISDSPRLIGRDHIGCGTHSTARTADERARSGREGRLTVWRDALPAQLCHSLKRDTTLLKLHSNRLELAILVARTCIGACDRLAQLRARDAVAGPLLNSPQGIAADRGGRRVSPSNC